MIILAVETSCDDTAAAVVSETAGILSSIVSSQTDLHHRYGGVVPELASRKHVESIDWVVKTALTEAGLSLDAVSAVAATQGPGLIGSLLVGFSFAKALAYAKNIPFIGVDHLKGHIASLFMQNRPPDFPFIALLASGGHTGLYHVSAPDHCKQIGRTVDDAAGEAFDKLSKMMGMGYPGGKIIEDLAAAGDPKAVFFKRPYLEKNEFNFSFSGIKTAAKRRIDSYPFLTVKDKCDIAAGFLAAVTDVLTHKLLTAAKTFHCRHIALVGGVAANRMLRETLLQQAEKSGLTLNLPAIEYCGDNAAMIAYAALPHLKAFNRTGLNDDVYSRTPF